VFHVSIWGIGEFCLEGYTHPSPRGDGLLHYLLLLAPAVIVTRPEKSWVYLAIINIQLEKKHKLVQGRQGIEGTGRLSSRCP